ncbi:Duf427 domain protein [Venturia nashicola]|uniref:Duf427 domain protein n=1 Tax=Venturia nashicola TaxID=86259 RepID=A0A4Z1PLN9_9PEZI|nr:Duf427 domain protein [Venturia nashicola]TLD36114.1 Duf427 domain protein [Venturia nashicola]
MPSIRGIAEHMLNNGPRKVSPTSRRVRVLFNNTYIVDTTEATHVWEHDYFPEYYVPTRSLQNCDYVSQEDFSISGTAAPGASILSIKIPGPDGVVAKTTDSAIAFSEHLDSMSAASPLAGLVRLDFNSMDGWLEEDTPIYVHPKDPFRRIDVLPSSRPIKITLSRFTLAESPSSVHLLETGLPTRYYLPLASLNQQYIRKSNFITKCPYKGDAEYYDVVINGHCFPNVAWYYRFPTLESAGIAGLVCFYNEQVDITLDGKALERPKRHFE